MCLLLRGFRSFETLLLELVEFGGGLFELIAEAAFLQGKVLQILLRNTRKTGTV